MPEHKYSDDPFVESAMLQAEAVESFGLAHPLAEPVYVHLTMPEFRLRVRRFIAAVGRLQRPELTQHIASLHLDFDTIQGAHSVRADVLGVVDHLRNLHKSGQLAKRAENTGALPESFVDLGVVSALRESTNTSYDLSKVATLCDELNSCYKNECYIACCLLIRTILNHVPKVFGYATFPQVVANAGRSTKELFGVLDQIARDIADYHGHVLVSAREFAPTRAQVSPFKAPLEVLLTEVMRRASAG